MLKSPLAYGAALRPTDWPCIAAAAGIAATTSVIPRLVSGPPRQPLPPAPLLRNDGSVAPELAMGVQAAASALVLVGLNAAFGLVESAWAITASTYVIASSAAGTASRVIRRIIGTLVGVSLGLAIMPLARVAPLPCWCAAAIATVIYAMALPERYDVACGAYAFTLVVTLAMTGDYSAAILGARAWETVLGAAAGFLASRTLLPLMSAPQPGGSKC